MAKKNKSDGFLKYSLKERYGIAVLISILIIVIVVPQFFFKSNTKVENYSSKESFKEDIFNFENQIMLLSDSILESKKKFDYNFPDLSVSQAALSPFPFDPNNLSEEKWKEIGLKDWQIKVIKNYESKGGRFNKKEDLEKMYCLKPSEYKILEPYIIISKKEFVKKENNKTREEFEKKEIILVEINSADSATLTTISGVGPVFASRIIKYRNLIGGFANVNQLREVYGMKDEIFDKIKPQITINNDLTKKININTVTLNELKKHPYLEYNTAKEIIDYRIINGNFTNIEQIKQIKLIHEDLYNKLKPYLIL